jgi:predicted glycoside hydrolase/deacetylase ChbG (UPF0249 family)
MRRLIITCDDLGMAQSINDAAYEALGSGGITSASVIVTAPTFMDVCAYARTHVNHDIGVHLTLTSGRKYSRWRPVLAPNTVPSLVDDDGYFWETPAAFFLHATVEDVRKEIRAQVLRAINNGITPTHLDVHESVLLANPDLLGPYIGTANEFGVPVRATTSALATLSDVSYPGVPLEAIFSITASTQPSEWQSYYDAVLRQMKHGLNELIVHLGYDNQELRTITRDKHVWGAHWRQRDLDVVMSAEFRSVLRGEGITLLRWIDVLELSDS